MKNFKSIAIALVVALTTLTATAQDKKINASKSTIAWVGKKVTGQHSGTVNFKDGILKFKSGKVSGGEFNIDMTTIAVTDLKAGEGKEKLEGHLKAADFFGTDKFPAAKIAFKTIKVKSANVYTITADLTIKNVTKPVTFDLTVNKNTATTSFNIDRTKYGIEYNSGSIFDGLGDKAISDEFEVTVNLVF
ncbi:YceI family protein [Flavobacterium subsaxonicum]|uniref:Lipid-binding protein n=1 Tax=Flavobacterium subsaxonicum WB 4.1-42 = DSM 21790 TaxID=1121898 RepID=A0A0A2MJK2_9FLAO|nr:YceI family protein [Flavobacterium subsaxonicum]KGO91643.1 lipid-binding protein [Flavobacterium subsaxonicum WB 4.1-42 = DSM 21790]